MGETPWKFESSRPHHPIALKIGSTAASAWPGMAGPLYRAMACQETSMAAANTTQLRLPTPGKIAIVATKPLANQRDLALAYSPGVAAACKAIVADPARSLEPDRARQSGRRHHQRHGGARPRRHRPARRQAGDGGQGGPLQEIRRHRRLRHRDRRARSRQAGRHHRRARADLRRHQSRGHQGARMLRRSKASCASA